MSINRKGPLIFFQSEQDQKKLTTDGLIDGWMDGCENEWMKWWTDAIQFSSTATWALWSCSFFSPSVLSGRQEQQFRVLIKLLLKLLESSAISEFPFVRLQGFLSNSWVNVKLATTLRWLFFGFFPAPCFLLVQGYLSALHGAEWAIFFLTASVIRSHCASQATENCDDCQTKSPFVWRVITYSFNVGSICHTVVAVEK